MANEFIARKGLIVSGSATVTGSLNVSAGITGSLQYDRLINVPTGILSSSTQINNLSGVSASFATTASAATSITFIPETSSYAYTSSIGLVAKAVDIVSGSIGTNLTQYTGSFTGSLTGELIGTASWASYAVTASYVSGAASTWDSISNKPAGILSSSEQINALSGVSASYALSASRAITASLALSVDYANITSKPTLISASSQVSYTGLSSIPSDIVSSSTQINALSGVSASYASNADLLDGINSTAFATTGSNTFVGNQTVTGSLTLSSSAATELQVVGDTEVTGSVRVTSGALTGSLFGTSSWASNAVSASFATTASAATSITFTPATASYALSSSQAGAVNYANVTNKPTLVSASSQIDVRQTTGITNYAITTGSNSFSGVQTITDTTNATNYDTGALVVDGGVGVEKDLYIGGDIRLAGTLYAVSQSILLITSSVLDVQDNRIITNLAAPQRFGGLSVNDSGSTNRSGSLYWDSVKNRWLYENEDGSVYDSAIIIAGPKHIGSLGDEPGMVTGRIPVASGDDHIDTRVASSSIRVDFPSRLTSIEAGLYITGSVTASTGFSGDGSNVTGVISSSFATTASAATSITFTPATASYAISSSRAITSSLALSADYTNITNKPTLISASSQVDHDATTNFVANEHIDHSTVSITAGSGLTGGGTIAATRTLDIGAGLGITVNADDVALNTSSAHFITGSISALNLKGVFSGSSQVSYTGLSNIPSGILSSSTQINALSGVSASYASNADLLDGINSTAFATTGSNTFVNNQTITGSLTISSSAATELQVVGDTEVTGSVRVTSGALTGSLFGTSSWASNVVSASYATTASSVISASFATTAATASSFSGSLQVVGMADFAEGLTVSGGLYISASDTTSTNKILVWDTSTKQVFTTASLVSVTSASYALSASYAPGSSGLSGGTANYIPLWTSATAQSSSIIYQTGGNVGINTTAPNRQLSVNGNANITGSLDVTSAFTAQTKSFKILHQTLSGKSLIYGVLEGPEHAVYVRGRLKGSTIITLPEEWEWLVDMESATVNLTPIGAHQKLYVDGIYGTRIVVGNDSILHRNIDCYYTVIATRKDVHPLKTVE